MSDFLFIRKYVINSFRGYPDVLAAVLAPYGASVPDVPQKRVCAKTLECFENAYWQHFAHCLIWYCNVMRKKIKISLIDADTPEQDWVKAARESEIELLKLADFERKPVTEMRNFLYYQLYQYKPLFKKWRQEKETVRPVRRSHRMMKLIEDVHYPFLSVSSFQELCTCCHKKMFIEIV